MSWQRSASHHGDGEQDGVSIPFECCNQKGFGHLQVVSPQRWGVVGRGGSYSTSDKQLETMHWDLPFFVLDLGLYIIDSIRRLYFKSNSLASERLHEDLHSWWLKMMSGRVEECLSPKWHPLSLYILAEIQMGLPHWHHDSAWPGLLRVPDYSGTDWKSLEFLSAALGSAGTSLYTKN